MIPFDRLAYVDSVRSDFERANVALAAAGKPCVPARVISLDRGFPLVSSCELETRAELATTIKKSDDSIIAVGDWVVLHCPEGHEKAVIERILPRRNEIARVKRAGRDHQMRRQVLAANVDDVLICQSLTGEGVDERLLMRQMTAVFGCGARPMFILTKADLVEPAFIEDACRRIRLVAPDVPLFVVSIEDEASVDRVRDAILPESTALLLGESGVGKSSLVNALMGTEVLEVGEVRASDDKGRHTTVARRLLPLPNGGLVIDAPGLRTLQIIDKAESLKAAFPDIARAALGCRFRDCTHAGEPGCAVQDEIAPERLEAYHQLLSSAI